MPASKQVQKDLNRDIVIVDGRRFNDKKEDTLNLSRLKATIAYSILQALRSPTKDTEERGDAALWEARAMMLASDVVMSCSRTLGQGDSFFAVRSFFRNDDVVCICPAPMPQTDAVSVSVLNEDALRSTLASITLNAAMPDFEGAQDAVFYSAEAVKRMSLHEHALQATALPQSEWVQNWECKQCMWCGVPFSSWMRRHHCRICGAVVCFNCSRYTVLLSKSTTDRSAKLRSCWLCYKKAALQDIWARKNAGSSNFQTEGADTPEPCSSDRCAPLTSPVSEKTETCAASDDASGKIAADDITWPVVNVEMSFRYRICAIDADSVDLYVLECKYLRTVRWSGCSDEGRVFVSIIPGPAIAG